MSDGILVVNAGSSSVHFSVFMGDMEPSRESLVCRGWCAGIGGRLHLHMEDAHGVELGDAHGTNGSTHEDALAAAFAWLERTYGDHPVAVAAHRVMHGGATYTESVPIDATVIAELERLVPLAPLHQPHNIAGIRALAKLFPALRQIACFDTAFHLTQPAVATAFALPREFAEEGIRRYGFHGLSYEYVAGVLPAYLGTEAAAGRVVVAHLGRGASLCALRGRRSIAGTTGFTALDGLPMSTRCGNLDPGVVLYLIEQMGLDAREAGDLLYNRSGLLGVSGISGEMDVLLASERQGAKDAVALFVYRVGRELGSLAAALGGIDALVFTAGIGENAGQIRRQVCEDAGWLGIDLDTNANAANGPRISRSASRTSAWVIPTDENLTIARHACAVLNALPRLEGRRATYAQTNL
jgi:acetate kinase